MVSDAAFQCQCTSTCTLSHLEICYSINWRILYPLLQSLSHFQGTELWHTITDTLSPFVLLQDSEFGIKDEESYTFQDLALDPYHTKMVVLFDSSDRGMY